MARIEGGAEFCVNGSETPYPVAVKKKIGFLWHSSDLAQSLNGSRKRIRRTEAELLIF